MKGNILIVDDEQALVQLIAKALDHYGYSYDDAYAVKPALEMIGENEYNIILTDKNMPSLDGTHDEGGMEVLKYARDHDPTMEIIMMTGYASLDSAIKAMRLGAFDYIMKPFDIEDLVKKIDFIRICQNFINSEDVVLLYKSLHIGMLEILDEQFHLSPEKQHRLLKFVNEKIDYMFRSLKNSERIIFQQRETLARLAALAEELYDNTPESDPQMTLIKKIAEQASQRA
ncbi:MAG: response regulator [Candidatus Latescibacteria bacterium]|nr:response regulator [Candidatus Latescibacterota bacterium]